MVGPEHGGAGGPVHDGRLLGMDGFVPMHFLPNSKQLVAGDRVHVFSKDASSAATVMRHVNRTKTGPCVQVMYDKGRNGAGALHCVQRSLLRLIPRVLLSDLARQPRGLAAPPPSSRGRDRATRLVRVPDDGGEAWSRGLHLPTYVLNTRAPEESAMEPRSSAGSHTRQPVLPTVFLPGFPKSATTWLYTCMAEAYTPRRAGCGGDASGWNASACPRRFLLTPLTARKWQRGEFILESRKETFYFGGTRQKFFRPDLLTLSGPNPARGALPGEPALWAWEHKGHRVARSQPLSPTAASVKTTGWSREQRAKRDREQRNEQRILQQRQLFERLGRMCLGGEPPCNGDNRAARDRGRGRRRRKQTSSSAATSSTAADAAAANASVVGAARDKECLHVACHHVIRDEPSTSNVACNWEPAVHTSLGRNDSFCLTSLLPHAAPGEFNLLVGDFTPNYLCDAEALPRLRASARDPDALRFVVVMREPAARARSEWAMFALQWAWDPIGDFGASFATRVKQVRECNATLFRNVTALKSLPTEELSDYLRECWNFGGALMYATNSMYSVCVLHALRHFKREQFLFLRYEDLMAMDARDLLRLIGRFTGLYAGDDLIEAVGPTGRCQPRGRKGGRNTRTYDTISPEEKVLYNASSDYLRAASNRDALDELFAPYNDLLTELVGHRDFSWR